MSCIYCVQHFRKECDLFTCDIQAFTMKCFIHFWFFQKYTKLFNGTFYFIVIEEEHSLLRHVPMIVIAAGHRKDIKILVCHKIIITKCRYMGQKKWPSLIWKHTGDKKCICFSLKLFHHWKNHKEPSKERMDHLSYMTWYAGCDRYLYNEKKTHFLG